LYTGCQRSVVSGKLFSNILFIPQNLDRVEVGGFPDAADAEDKASGAGDAEAMQTHTVERIAGRPMARK
jgi:hypothetical protein